jgi:hypothetical protein
MLPFLLLCTLLALAGGAPSVAAQIDDLDEQPGSETAEQLQGVLGSVNGKAITLVDLAHFVSLRSGGGGAIDPAMILPIRRQIAEQILQASEAERLGIELSDVDVENFWEEYLGTLPDFELLAQEAGSTTDRQRALARRTVLAEIFLYHKVGIWAEFGAYIKPDPVLKQLVDVTPGELRQLFKDEREQFEQPASVAYTFYPCENAAQADTVRQTLVMGQPIEEITPGQERVQVPEIPRVFAFSSELVSFLQTGVKGEISKVFEIGLEQDEQQRALIFTIDDRRPASSPDFREVQEDIRRYLQLSRLDLARRQLVNDLQARAVFWPQDLFQETLTDAAQSSGPIGP